MVVAGNYVEVLVKSRDEAKPDLDDLKASLDELSKKVAEARAGVDTAEGAAKLDALQAKLLKLQHTTANPKISMTSAISAEAQLHKFEAELDKFSGGGGGGGGGGDGGSAGAAGDAAGRSFLSRFGEWLKPSKFQLITSGLATALATLPALGAVAGVGMVGALGAKIADGIPSIAKQFTGLGATATKSLQTAVKPMLPAITSVVGDLSNYLKQSVGEFSKVFAAAAPSLGPLTFGLLRLVSGVLPGLIALLKAAQPAIAAFAGLLGNLGTNLGGMFEAFAPALKASGTVLTAVGTIINALLPTIGKLAAVLAGSLAPIIQSFGQAFADLAPGIGAVGAILGKLAGAVLASLAGAMEAIAQLLQAVAPSFAVLASVLGQVFTAMENSGVFGVLEDALESLVGPLGRLISLIVSSLAPILGQVIGLVAQVAASVGDDLVSAVVALLPVVTQLVPVIATVAQALLSVLTAAIVPLLPGISKLLQLVTTFLVQALTPLIPSIGQLALALVKILMAVTPLLPPLLQLITLWVKLNMDALKPVIAVLPTVVGWLTKLVTWIAEGIAWIAKYVTAGLKWIESLQNVKRMISDVVDWVTSHWPLLLGILTGPIGLAVAYIISHWSRLEDGAKSMIANVVTFFSQLPGKILAAISHLWQDLYNVGANIISGLRQGIDHAVSGLLGDVSSIGDKIVGGFKSALSIFSPSKRMDVEVGQPIMAGAGQGMKKGLTGLVSIARQAGQAVVGGMQAGASGGYGGGLAAAGGGVQRIELEFVGGDGPIITALRGAIRARGGSGKNSVQIALGQTH
jgi:phage-related protein